MKGIMKLNWDEMENTNFIAQTKPKFATTTVVINDENEVYAQNGSEFYKINFIQDLQQVIFNTTGNQGWFVVDKQSGKQYLPQLLDELYEKDYIGNHQY
jgi:uncharacterized lipoprotein